MEHVIVERVYAEPLSLEALHASIKDGAPCRAMHRVRLLRASLSSDGLRVICEYEAPDVESVRIMNRRLGLRFERAWSATVVHNTDP